MVRPVSIAIVLTITVACGHSVAWSQVKSAESLWNSHVKELLSDNCLKCHNPKKKSGRLDLSSIDSLMDGGKNGKVVKAGQPEESLLYKLVLPGSKPHMPPGGKQLSEEQISILQSWIQRLDHGKDLKRDAVRNTGKQANENTRLELPGGIDPTTIIDLLIEKKWSELNAKTSLRINDRRFAYRIYLDLVGRIPAPEELSRFVKNTQSNKRAQLADQLLSSDEHAEYFASVLDTLLMGRGNAGSYSQRKSNGWNQFLRNAIQKNRPWDSVVRDILLARPANADSKGSVWFLYEKKNNHQQIAESVAPAVFGIRIECAQCHDHPLAGEIEQKHYWGLVAFFKRGKNTNTKQGPRVVESAIGGFEEFTDLSGKSYPNELVFLGKPVVQETRPPAGKKQKDANELYVAVASEEPRVPKFSRRKEFVDKVLNEHPKVADAMVNRVWALLMGRGIVHPFDKMDSAHPPSHPVLLEWLSRDFRKNGYNVRRLLKKIVLSKAYQLDPTKPSPASDPASFAWSLEKPLTAEAWTRSIAQLLRGSPESHAELLNDFRKYFPDVLPEENMTRLDQTMFLSNGASLNRFVKESHQKGHLHNRLTQLGDNSQRMNLLYQNAFGRSPDKEELEAGVKFLSQRTEKLSEALDMMIWAIVTSAEFRINH